MLNAQGFARAEDGAIVELLGGLEGESKGARDGQTGRQPDGWSGRARWQRWRACRGRSCRCGTTADRTLSDDAHDVFHNDDRDYAFLQLYDTQALPQMRTCEEGLAVPRRFAQLQSLHADHGYCVRRAARWNPLTTRGLPAAGQGRRTSMLKKKSSLSRGEPWTKCSNAKDHVDKTEGEMGRRRRAPYSNTLTKCSNAKCGGGEELRTPIH